MMKSSLVFFGKEVREIFRTYKIYALPLVLLAFGFASPILTKILPDILEGMAGDVAIQLPEMTWRDSYEQLFKNLSQIGMLVLIITTMGTVADEKSRGVALLVLTKPLSRTGYLLSKYAATALLLTVSTVVAFGAAWYYTTILFEGTQLMPGLAATGLFILYALLVAAVTLLCSVISRSLVAAGGLAVLGYFILSIMPVTHHQMAVYSPAALLSYQQKLLTGAEVMPQLGWAIAICVMAIAAVLAVSAVIFSRQEL